MRRHLLHGIAVGHPVVLRVMVLRIGIMVHGRVCLRRDVVVVLMLLPPSLVHRAGRRAMRARHHGQLATRMLPSQSVAGRGTKAPNV